MKQRRREAFLRDLSFVCPPRLMTPNPKGIFGKISSDSIVRHDISLENHDILSEQTILSEQQQQSIGEKNDSTRVFFGPEDLMTSQYTENGKDIALNLNCAQNSSYYSSDGWEESEINASYSCSLESTPGNGKKRSESSYCLTLEEAAAAVTGTVINATSLKNQKGMDHFSQLLKIDYFCHNESIDDTKISKCSKIVGETIYEQQLAIIIEEIKYHREKGSRIHQ